MDSSNSGKSSEPVKNASSAKRELMLRRGLGTKGNRIRLRTNHFRVDVGRTDVSFHHYSVAISYADGHPVDAKGIGRKVLDKVYETYNSDLGDAMNYAYDGERSLFSLVSLPHIKSDFPVILDEISSVKVGPDGSPGSPEGDRKRMRRQSQSKAFNVAFSHAAKIPMQAIVDALRGQESGQLQEALRVLNIILRQHAAKQGCLLVRQSFFHHQPTNYRDLGGGVQVCRGFHSSFRATQGGLSLNIDASSTMLLKPGPVLDFLLENQNVNRPDKIDWNKAKRMLKNLRIKANNIEYKITGITDLPCNRQKFSFKKGRNADGQVQSDDITVLDYFENVKNIKLRQSAGMPCINVGKPRRPMYFPVEFCSLVSLQRYTKALTNLQRAALVEVSRQTTKERIQEISNSLRDSAYENDPILQSYEVNIVRRFTEVEGRILQPPSLRVGNDEDFLPRNGRWNFNNKKLAEPCKIEHWAIVDFTQGYDRQGLLEVLRKCSQNKGGIFKQGPLETFKENPEFKSEPAPVRVERMYEKMRQELDRKPEFLLCILPERKNSDIYGPWKRRSLCEEGIVTQCIASTRVNDQYVTNVLLKINAKLGGMNSFLSAEKSSSRSLPLVCREPTLILGMDVSHGSPGRSDVPSIAAVVSSRCWPEVSRYRAALRTQSPKAEMIANLFDPVSDTEDHGIIRELLEEFRNSSGRKPKNIIIFRDGVSESQFIQVLNDELDQIIQACKHYDKGWDPKFTLIVAQKNHHTRFFDAKTQANVPPGTVIDNTICHPKNNDFYMCAHAGIIGTSRPTHYHVLHDEIGFSADDVQELVHSLSYVYQRSTTAISAVAPICYAHLAAAQVGQFMKFDEFSESSSSHGGATSAGAGQVPELPRLHKDVINSMFFC